MKLVILFMFLIPAILTPFFADGITAYLAGIVEMTQGIPAKEIEVLTVFDYLKAYMVLFSTLIIPIIVLFVMHS